MSFAEFRQVVRRYRPSDLLPVVAAVACESEGPPLDMNLARVMAPWAIPVIARESVLRGNEHRKAGISPDDVRALFHAFNEISEGGDHTESDWLHSTLTRIAYEQFPYQESIFEEVTRTHALLVEGLPHITPEVLSDDAWTRILGAPLHQAIGATFFLHVGALQNRGWFRRSFLDLPGLDVVFDAWPKDVVLHRVERLSSDFSQFRTAYDAVPAPMLGYERYAYNPLTRRPFLRWPDGDYLAPQPQLILRTVTPGGLYYAGVDAFGEAFARDLGHLTEHYVGEQLRTIDGADVYPEIVYGRQHTKSIDWFLVLPSVVVMFEVKSTRFGLQDRFADPGFEGRIASHLQKAIKQIERSSAALDGADPAFAEIPADRPRIGVVVTAEPYYLANSPMVRALLPSTTIPVLTASLREIEHLVSLPAASIARQLLEIVHDSDRSTWMLGNALTDTTGARRNPILDRAWDAYPWPVPDDEPDETAGAPPLPM